jgi:hypothetical protein
VGIPVDEQVIKRVIATRKGRGQALCEIIIARTDEGEIILRALDESGVPPIVAILDKNEAADLATGLQEAVEKA